MLFLELFYTFFIIGVFGFGGGYGMLSLIQTQTVNHHHWLSTAEFTNIVAISQMTPGPIGINSATYCGYTAVHNAGMGEALAVLGSFTATFALVLPSFVLMVLISKMFMKYMNTPMVQSIFIGLRPTVVESDISTLCQIKCRSCDKSYYSRAYATKHCCYPWHIHKSMEKQGYKQYDEK